MPAAVVLWWGPDIRIAGGGRGLALTLGERDDPVSGIVSLVGDGSVFGDSVRIIYHPAGLDVREIDCPNAGRTRLRRLLSAEHGALLSQGTLWCVEPARPGGDHRGALLHIDVDSPLPRLVGELAGRGIRVEGAWPLQTLVGATPPYDSPGGAALGVVALGGRALVSCETRDGGRFVRFHEGPDFAHDAAREVGTALALLDGSGPIPTLCSLEDGPAAGTLRSRIGDGPRTDLPLPALLERARMLKPGGLSDFLARGPDYGRGIPFPAIAAALGAALLAWSVWSVRTTLLSRERLGTQAAAAGERRAQLRIEVADRLAVRDRIRMLGRSLEQVECPRQEQFELLLALAHSTPSRIVLTGVSTEGGQFSIKGRCVGCPSGPEAAIAAFRKALGGDGLPWRIARPAQGIVPADGEEFTLEGTFR